MTHRRKVAVRKRLRRRRALYREFGEELVLFVEESFMKALTEEVDKAILYGEGRPITELGGIGNA